MINQTEFTRRRLISLGALMGGTLVAAPVLAGCSSPSGPATTTGTKSGNGGETTRDVITMGSAVDVLNFDPYAQTTNAIIVLRMLNAWLLNYDEDLKPQLDTLESYEISDDRTSCTLRLRDDVVFTTGKTMTADDVVFAFERAMNPETGFNLASPSQIIESVSTPEPLVVELQFKGPTSQTLIEDLLVGQPVVDMDHNSAEGLATEPASAGPYRLVNRTAGQSLTLEANPDWYRGDVKTPNIELRIFTDTRAMTSGLESGALDLAVYVPPRDGQRLKESFEYLDSYPGSATMLLRVSAITAPFDQKSLRQALWHSVNRERIVQEVLFGFGGAAALPWGPNSPAQDDSYDDRVQYDLEKAKTLLADVSVTQGGAMVNGSDPISISVMQIIQADLASIGFDLQIEQVDAATFQDRLVAGEFGVVLGQMGGGQLSLPRITQNSLFRLSNNPLWPDGTPPQAYIDAIQTLTSEQDDSARQAAFDELNDVIVDEAWAIGTYYVPQLYMFTPELKDVARDHQNALVMHEATF
jgi:peptide/nickel transport system substrate-binding protein